jgi:hypothetical protein
MTVSFASFDESGRIQRFSPGREHFRVAGTMAGFANFDEFYAI